MMRSEAMVGMPSWLGGVRLLQFVRQEPENGVWIGLSALLAGVLLAVLSYLAAAGQLRVGWERQPLQHGVVAEIGFAYQAPLSTARFSGHVTPSDAVILENDRELGPGNAQHDDVRKRGGGYYSFWGDWVYFSASDNSDPRTNGRTYVAYGPGPLTQALPLLAGVPGGALMIVGIWVCRAAVRSRWSVDRSLSATFWDGLSQRDPVLIPLLSAILVVLAGAALITSYLLFLDPAVWLNRAHERVIGIVGTLLVGAAGFVIGWAVVAKQASRALAWLMLLIGITVLVVFPYSGVTIQFFIRRLSLLVFGIGIAAGFRHARRAGGLGFSSLPVTAVVVVALLLSLPDTLAALVESWNNSGYMDSQMYDLDAHQIALGEAVEGNSFVMPLYQYGMAALYFVFGHFFYVQQIANVVLQCFTVVLLTLAAYVLFQDVRAAALMGVMAALTPQLRQFVRITQIENWYVPLIAGIVFVWVMYRRRPTLNRALSLGVAIGLAFNCRSQGAFFFALMCLAPLLQSVLTYRTRIVHTLAIGLVVAASLVPWSARNYVYEGRFSPTSDQATIGLLFNDHRVGFYGLRWDLYSWQEVLKEYEAAYPEKAERFAAIQRDAIRNTWGDPAWWARAFGWRTLSFYGLLPPGVWAPKGPVPTNWSEEWSGYVYDGITPLVLIPLSVLAIVRRPSRESLFLAAGIGANLAVMLFASQTESRISFPVLPMHMLLALALVFPFAPVTPTELRSTPRTVPAWRHAALAAVTLLIVAVALRMTVGHTNRNAPLIEQAIVQSSTALEEHRARGIAYRDVGPAEFAEGLTPRAGERVRIRCRLSNYMLPPKSAGAVSYLPPYASDPSREQYYYAKAEDGTHVIGVTYFGAVASGMLRENDLVTIEGRVLPGDRVPLLKIPFWLQAEAIYRQAETTGPVQKQ